MNEKPIYKIIDDKGRVYLPKGYMIRAGLEKGDIIRINMNKGNIELQKVLLVEVGDQSQEAVEAFVDAAVNVMGAEKRIQLIKRLCNTLEDKNMLENTII